MACCAPGVGLERKKDAVHSTILVYSSIIIVRRVFQTAAFYSRS